MVNQEWQIPPFRNFSPPDRRELLGKPEELLGFAKVIDEDVAAPSFFPMHVKGIMMKKLGKI